MIGATQQLITLSQHAIVHLIMSLGCFCAMPCKGHLQQLKHVIGHVKKCSHCTAEIHTGIQIARNSLEWIHNWMETVCGSPQKEIDSNATPTEGKSVHLSSFANASLMHDMVMARFASGILQFLNQMHADWFCKQQCQVEMVAQQAT